LYIIGMSADATEAEVRGAGCDDFLAKPFELDTLLDQVKRGLALSLVLAA
jgi:DNA-binding response OmpR family regulator